MPAYNSTFAIGGVSPSADSFVVKVEYIIMFCNFNQRQIAMGGGRSFPNRFNAWTLVASITDNLRIDNLTMAEKKNIFVIIGSASQNSANQKLVDNFANLIKFDFNLTIFSDLKKLPHFDPELSSDNPPKLIVEFRELISKADGILISTPEYVFSIPSGLKNAIEWCVSTTVFSDKPIGLLTASAHGQKGHEELQLIMKTVMTKFTDETTLLIQGIKGKINEQGEITDTKTTDDLTKFINAFKTLIKNASH
ncbi:MAG: NAD(P)H-dependent oxidoreductase [Chitinophagaceae bacterium]|nr:NAD(P)H-dependent oxidoreductase [Chitinophagaceae bacterium]MDP1811065.1 NADPH-dependent FMN reductase [Sediminibacterium sp.]MDP3128261.1 NADPH-dependent FMN reductase [Sediminibacterium sp.]